MYKYIVKGGKKKLKILLISGHGAGDPGAVGNNYQEKDLTREVVDILAKKIQNYANVEIYDQSRNAYNDVKGKNTIVNFGEYEYVLEVHFNARRRKWNRNICNKRRNRNNSRGKNNGKII